MEGYIKLTAAEFVAICNTFDFISDLFGPPWYYGDDGNLYIQEVK